MRLSWPSKTCSISRFVHLALRGMKKLKRKDRFVTITYHTDEFVQTFTIETIFSKWYITGIVCIIILIFCFSCYIIYFWLTRWSLGKTPYRKQHNVPRFSLNHMVTNKTRVSTRFLLLRIGLVNATRVQWGGGGGEPEDVVEHLFFKCSFSPRI